MGLHHYYLIKILITLYTGENPYGFMAHLVDPLTEGHTDSTDWAQGMAALTCFGTFTGKFSIFLAAAYRIF
jgi:hypothetical protein